MKALIQWFRNLIKPARIKHEKRICFDCKLPIKRTHKYVHTWIGDGLIEDATPITVHRDCENPELNTTDQLAI